MITEGKGGAILWGEGRSKRYRRDKGNVSLVFPREVFDSSVQKDWVKSHREKYYYPFSESVLTMGGMSGYLQGIWALVRPKTALPKILGWPAGTTTPAARPPSQANKLQEPPNSRWSRVRTRCNPFVAKALRLASLCRDSSRGPLHLRGLISISTDTDGVLRVHGLAAQELLISVRAFTVPVSLFFVHVFPRGWAINGCFGETVGEEERAGMVIY
ncbi:hypothetical protein RHGRI_014386 [Rhododendron griersonianum]|uniref:Uncharacterized protein n=1 Tax=Rhododendron griersonianum TaxID=479676 RepID=A0AAV6K931_9ERIC|nr:hypothetical protein RHGRI_014386 [Rhododendron griersonianum]